MNVGGLSANYPIGYETGRTQGATTDKRHPEFRNDELIFYNKFLDNLRGR